MSFMKASIHRCVENMLSVKVWLFCIPLVISTFVLMHVINIVQADGSPSADVVSAFKGWLTFVVSLAGTIVVVREIFKVSKINALAKTAMLARGSASLLSEVSGDEEGAKAANAEISNMHA